VGKKNKKSPEDIALEAMRMDLDFRNRELATQQAIAAAQQAFERQRMMLIEQGAQAQQADQFARQYALQIGQLEFEKTLGTAQLGLSAQGQAHAQRMDLMRQQFDEQFNTAAQMGFRDGVPTLDRYKFDQTLGEQQRQFDVGSTGYNNGRATLEREQMERGLGEEQRQFNVGQSGFMNGAATLEREKALENQRQFDVSTIMNAPRGAADYVGYIRNLRGLEGQGLAPGLLAQLAGGEAVRAAGVSNGGQSFAPAATNADLAQAAVAQSRRNGTLSASMDPRLAGLMGTGAQQNVQVSYDPSQGRGVQPTFSPSGGDGGGASLSPQGQPPQQGVPSRFGDGPKTGVARPQQFMGTDMQTNGPESFRPGEGVKPSTIYGEQSFQPPSMTLEGQSAAPNSFRDAGAQGSGQMFSAADFNDGPNSITPWNSPSQYQRRGFDDMIPYQATEGWAQNQADRQANRYWNANSDEANRAYSQAERERASVMGDMNSWLSQMPQANQYGNYQYRSNGQETQPTVNGATQRPGSPYAPSNQTFGQYASQPSSGSTQDVWSSAAARASSPYNESAASQSSGGSGSNQAVQGMMGQVYQQDNTPRAKTGDQWSLQSFRKLNPTEQEFASGLVGADTGQSDADFKWGMQNAAPNYARSKSASWGGF
jgi:hypothetical protein